MTTENKEVLDGKAWRKKYYPVEAKELANASDIDCVTHSLNKWRGLTEQALQTYDLYGADYLLNIDTSSCALCWKYINWIGFIDISGCMNCPLGRLLGKGCQTEYDIFIEKNNPIPMIEALERTLLMLQQEDKINTGIGNDK